MAVPMEYTAVYEVLRKDKPVARVTLELSQHGEEWTFRGFTHDMQGLAKLLHVEGEQAVVGSWQQGYFQPDSYSFSFTLVGFKNSWRAEFDWPAKIVTTHSKQGKTSLPLAGGAMDPMSLFLNTGSYLSEGRVQIPIDLIDEDEIKNHLYAAQTSVLLETMVGCMKTTRVKRVRENSTRTSLAWYAETLGYIPVKLQHFKKKGKGMQVRIISLLIDGQDIRLPASCPSEAG